MVALDKAVIARFVKGKSHFEILVDPELAAELKKGKNVSIQTMLAVQGIFKDARKGERVPEAELKLNFGTTDVAKIAEIIVKEGEVQFTTEQRRRAIEEKKKQIIDIIARQAIDPHTGLPHPPTRIANAIEHVRIAIDPFKPAEAQVEGVIGAIQQIIPIKMERVEVAIKIPIEWAGKGAAIVRQITSIKKEEWKSDGWFALVEIPAGLQSEIYSKLAKLTGGHVETKVVRKI
jgi:ribosome maturation protein SDO1